MLRYPGGKWKAAKWIIQNFPIHTTYVEVFGGGASVLLQKQKSRTEVYNDINQGVVNVFQVMRDVEKSKELMRLLDLTPFAYDEYLDCYNEPLNDVDYARRMIARSFMGIGSDSVFRQNGFRRGFNNKELNANNNLFSYSENIPMFTERLKSVIIENMDYKDLIKMYDNPSTLFYVDPPYLDEVLSIKRQYYEHKFDLEEHKELAEILRNVKGKVVLSGYPSELYDTLYLGWNKTMKDLIVGDGSKRYETIWVNRPDLTLF